MAKPGTAYVVFTENSTQWTTNYVNNCVWIQAKSVSSSNQCSQISTENCISGSRNGERDKGPSSFRWTPTGLTRVLARGPSVFGTGGTATRGPFNQNLPLQSFRGCQSLMSNTSLMHCLSWQTLSAWDTQVMDFRAWVDVAEQKSWTIVWDTRWGQFCATSTKASLVLPLSDSLHQHMFFQEERLSAHNLTMYLRNDLWCTVIESVGGCGMSGPLCHLVCSLQTERYSAEDTLYQLLTPWWKQYLSTRAYTRTGL